MKRSNMYPATAAHSAATTIKIVAAIVACLVIFGCGGGGGMSGGGGGHENHTSQQAYVDGGGPTSPIDYDGILAGGFHDNNRIGMVPEIWWTGGKGFFSDYITPTDSVKRSTTLHVKMHQMRPYDGCRLDPESEFRLGYLDDHMGEPPHGDEWTKWIVMHKIATEPGDVATYEGDTTFVLDDPEHNGAYIAPLCLIERNDGTGTINMCGDNIRVCTCWGDTHSMDMDMMSPMGRSQESKTVECNCLGVPRILLKSSK